MPSHALHGPWTSVPITGAALLFVSAVAVAPAHGQARAASPARSCTLQGAITFKPGYAPRQADQAALSGLVLLLKDPTTGAVLGKAVTDGAGRLVFPGTVPVSGSGGGSVVAKQVCNDKGDCFDFQPLPPDENVLTPIDYPDPPLQAPKRTSGPPPPLVFGAFTCVPTSGGAPVKMAVKKAEPRDKTQDAR